MSNLQHEHVVLRENAANFHKWISDAKERLRKEEDELKTNQASENRYPAKGDKAA